MSPEGIVEFCAQAAILCEAMEAGGAMKKGVLAGIDDFIFQAPRLPATNSKRK